jgi:hypothetical protein
VENVTVLSQPRAEHLQSGAGNGSAPSDPVEVEVLTSSDEIPYDTLAPKRLTAASWHNREAAKSFNFKLNHMSILMGEPVTARVRIVNLVDRSLLKTLPSEVRKLCFKLFFGNQNSTRAKNDEVKYDQQLDRLEDILHAYGCAGFLEPRLVLKPEEVRNPEEEMWVGDIPMADLQEWMRICEGDDALAARRLEEFPG